MLLIAGLFIISCERESRILSLELEIEELVCNDGQRILEGCILNLKGIKTVTANIQTQKAQVRYRESMVSAEQIKTQLLEFGFTVDGTAGNPVSRSRLPSCCFEQFKK